MTPEQQRIKIAEVHEKIPPGFSRESLGGFYDILPNYLNSIDAIREACLWALDNLWDSDQAEAFTRTLSLRSPTSTFTLNGDFDPHDAAQIIIRSDAADWCFAFLNASGLWKES